MSISTSINGPFVITVNPLTVTNTGTVTSTGTLDAVDGAATDTWTITNDGTVSSAGGRGISLAGPGIVSNGPTSGATASISGGAAAIEINGVGTVSNQGRISGIEGVKLNAGGNVSNASSGSISASGTVGGGFGIGAGVYIAHAPGSVTNNGIISGGAYGVAMSVGGSVTNTASINGGEDGVIFNGGFGTVSNTGQIIASVDDGIGMFTGGSVTNATGALISGSGTVSAGIFITGGLGSVLNSGRITTNNGKFGVLLTGSGGSVSNAASGSIDGYTAGVFINGQPGTVTNAGSITATGPSGVDLEAGGKVTNQTSGIISGHLFGVFITGGSGTVANSGAISSGKYGAIELTSGGNVTNNAGGSISGSSSGVYFGSKAAGTVTNSGSITAVGVASAGVQFALGGSVINNSGGSISGTGFGVFATGAAGTLTNFGTITGLDGIGLKNGGNVTNETGASILGQSAGVFSQGGVATLSNTGSISATGSGGAALDIEAGGSISNAAGGSITGASFGVFVTGGSGTIVNAGRIAGTSNTGIDLASGGNVSNAAGASISAGGFGVAVYGTGGTVTNNGTISGTSHAVTFAGSGANRLVVGSTGVFIGGVVGSTAAGSTNTLELAGGSGTISGLSGGSGTVTENANTWSFSNFPTIAVAAGAAWTLSGTVATILDNGTLTVANGGSLTADITLGGGTLTDGSGLTLGTGMSLAGNGIVNAGLSGTGTVTADGGTLDLTSNILAGVRFDINTSSVLQIDGSIGSGATFGFSDTSELVYNNSGGITVTINGLDAGTSPTVPTNFIDYKNHTVTLNGSNAHSGKSGTVGLSDGSVLTLSGVIGSASWFVNTESDGDAGTNIFLSQSPVIPAPVVTTVTASGSGITAGNGDLGTGHVVTLTMHLSDAVTVAGGVPTLLLNDGGTADYTGGSGSNALTFVYTVLAGQKTPDLAVTGSGLNGATLLDAAGNEADLAGAVTNLTGTLQIGTTAPSAPSTPTPNPTTPGIAVLDTTTGQSIPATAQPYTGPVSGLQNEYINITQDSLNITVSTPNWFLHSGGGNDALAVTSGTNVLDGGTGSNFLTGGGGTDTFFVDDRGPTADIWSTVNGFHAGDAATIWGVTPRAFGLAWVDGQGATGYTGLTLHATASGQPTASLTLAGYTSAALNDGRLSVSFGTVGGSAYMYVHGNS